MKLSELFKTCNELDYDTAGDSVNYKFIEDGTTLYIYFQGSNQISDWVRNFLFKKRPYNEMEIPFRVHRGFLAAWKEVEDIIINKITDSYTELVKTEDMPRPSIKRFFKFDHIVVVGYSHGGALAAFCHECCWFYRPDLRKEGLEGYGFEAPRIYGGLSVKEELKERWAHFTVIRTNNDIVTHCPPSIFGYTHVGNLLKVVGDTHLVKNNLPICVKSHYPQVVYDALVKYEENS